MQATNRATKVSNRKVTSAASKHALGISDVRQRERVRQSRFDKPLESARKFRAQSPTIVSRLVKHSTGFVRSAASAGLLTAIV